MQSYSYNFSSTGMVLTNTWIIASSHNPKQLINESDLFAEDDIPVLMRVQHYFCRLSDSFL